MRRQLTIVCNIYHTKNLFPEQYNFGENSSLQKQCWQKRTENTLVKVTQPYDIQFWREILQRFLNEYVCIIPADYDWILEYVAMQIAIFRILILGTHDY